MVKPNNYNSTSVDGDFIVLPADGYVCQILGIEETVSQNSGKEMLKVALDICEGDYAGFFQMKWKEKKLGAENPSTVKYPSDGIAYIVTEDANGNCSKRFKGFCTALEDSGIEVWGANDEFLIGNVKNAKVGVIFRREESEYNGKTYWNTKPMTFRSVQRIEDGDYTIPDDKYLEKPIGFNPYTPTVPPTVETDSFSAAEDDIPF